LLQEFYGNISFVYFILHQQWKEEEGTLNENNLFIAERNNDEQVMCIFHK